MYPENTALSREFSLKSLLSFSMPTICMMVFMSLYTSVDGIFVSHYISSNALAAVNLVYPVFSFALALSLMLAAGGNALIARWMGEGHLEHARQFFSLLYLTGLVSAAAITGLVWLFDEQLLQLLGCTPVLQPYAQSYLLTLSLFLPLSYFQMFAQNFFVTEGKPMLGLTTSMAGGVANILLDWLFLGPMGMDISGAAIATGIGYAIPGLFGIVYFFRNRKGSLCFVLPRWEGRALASACFNGASELVNNLSVAITTMLFNLMMLHYAGEDGVAAITVILYVQFIQSAVYFGYTQSVSPVISYKYGQQDRPQLRHIVRLSLWITMAASVLVILLSVMGADWIIDAFLGAGSPIHAMTRRGFLIFSSAYLFMGLNIFYSAMFTAFGDGRTSALLSFMRTLVFLVGALLLLPLMLDLDGVWLAVPVAEALSFLLGIWCYRRYGNRYGYRS